jgi:2,3-bisphosphoglycerate-independent phosphoglycerate mutase
MKFIILHCDGVADEKIKELDYRTPLEAAKTPNIDTLANRSELGLYEPIPKELHPGSDVGTLSLLGYDPLKYYTGRAPLEAASLGIELGENDVAFRCNLVNVKEAEGDFIMEDYSGGHLTAEEGKILIEVIQKELGNSIMTFYPGVGYRNILVWKEGPLDAKIPPPHDIMGKKVNEFVEGYKVIKEIFKKSYELLSNHPLNLKRMSEGKRPANAIWLWGQGKTPNLPPLKKIYNIESAVISAVDLVRGIGKLAGMKIINVPGATGYMDTNFKGKVEACVETLKEVDLVVLHVEGIDEVSHTGDAIKKVQAIEIYDSEVVGRLMEKLKGFKDFKILLTSDHRTPVRIKTHSHGAVPYLIFSSNSNKNTGLRWTESDCAKGNYLTVGYELFKRFLKEE